MALISSSKGCWSSWSCPLLPQTSRVFSNVPQVTAAVPSCSRIHASSSPFALVALAAAPVPSTSRVVFTNLKQADLVLPKKRSVRPSASTARAGKVYLVGAGPGDPGLLTLRAHQLLQTADVILHDGLVTNAVLDLIPPGVERIDVGKVKGIAHIGQDYICSLLLTHATSGKTVVRLKGGDPFLFGRAIEEVEACRAADIDVEVVPGVSSINGVTASNMIPLTSRGLSGCFAVFTGSRCSTSVDVNKVLRRVNASSSHSQKRPGSASVVPAGMTLSALPPLGIPRSVPFSTSLAAAKAYIAVRWLRLKFIRLHRVFLRSRMVLSLLVWTLGRTGVASSSSKTRSKSPSNRRGDVHQSEGKPDDIDWVVAARVPTAVFLMAIRFLPTIAANLLAHGRSPTTPIAIIEHGTTDSQRVVMGTLGEVTTLTARSLRSPAVVVVGDAVRQLHRDDSAVDKLADANASAVSDAGTKDG